MIHHGDEQIQQDHDIDHRVGAEHEHAPEASKDFNSVQLETVQVDQTKNGPE